MNEDLEDEQIEKPINKKMTIFNFVLIVVIFVGLFVYMIKVDGIENIINVLNKVDYRWVILGLIALIIHWICESITLHIPIKKMYPSQKISESIRVSMIGLLFNNITPFSSGGQPIQAYELSKTGKRVSDSLSALAVKFIITQTALVVTTIVIVFIELEFFKNLLKGYMWIAVLGIVVNIVAIFLVVLAGISKKTIKAIIKPFIKLFGKMHLLKNPDNTMEKMNHSIDNFSEQFKVIHSEKKMVLEMFIVAVVQSMAYYSITYMVYRAFGNYGITFFQIVPIQALLLLIMTFIPTPGSGVGAEGGFYLLFNQIFKNGTINMSILFWRLYTFYLPIIVGALFLIPRKLDKRDTSK